MSLLASLNDEPPRLSCPDLLTSIESSHPRRVANIINYSTRAHRQQHTVVMTRVGQSTAAMPPNTFHDVNEGVGGEQSKDENVETSVES